MPDPYPGAVHAAMILEAAAAEEIGEDLSEISFKPAEEAALSRALHGLEVGHDGALPTGLHALWDGIRHDAGGI
jgi:hypothetical protein